ncbi:MAG: hypothetical protein N2170_02005 [Bacteroidia bacterium]|nr:hypothetical protein [Bacteroidia bacterium]
MRLPSLFFLLFYSSAQPLPDSLWFVDLGGDTTHIVTFQTASTGWTAAVYQAEGTSWRLFETDTLGVDTTGRLLYFLRYRDTTGSSSPKPYKKLELAYSYDGYQTLTISSYDESNEIFSPQERIHMWGGAERWDSLLEGWLGLLSGEDHFQEGEKIWPFPFLYHRRHWGDSLLVEAFDSSVNLFVEVNGYRIQPSSGGCDSFLLYEAPQAASLIRGYYRLCANGAGHTLSQTDSFCTSSVCSTQERLWAHNGQGRPTRDSLVIRLYNSQGQFIGTTTSVRAYQWDIAGRLLQASYPAGTYILRYGNQVVSLASGRLLPLYLQGRGKTLYIQGALPGERVYLYDLSARLLWSDAIPPEGILFLPEFLPTGVYIVYLRGRYWRLAVSS